MDNRDTSSSSTPKCSRVTEKESEIRQSVFVDRQISLTSNTTMRELMTSAAVDIYNNKHRPIRCRALLDTCFTANFITEKLATALRLPKRKLSIPVGALNSMATTTKHIVTATIKSIHDGFEKTLTFLTIPRISDPVPTESFARGIINIPSNIRLADPEFNKANAADLLLGSGPTLSMLCIGQINLSDEGVDLILQKTRLGWVIGGSVGNKHAPASCFATSIQQDLTRFWEIEEGSSTKHFSLEELQCEEHFRKNVSRDVDGRYVVALPFKGEHPPLGESRGRAINRLNSLQRKFKLDKELQKQYTAVIDEYLQLGHMSECQDDDGTGFYLPHHAVIKESSNTTKVRVVFDGSAKTSSGISLNDALMVGPTIQDDIFSLILRFRLHNYVITADIEKMYRQFLIRRSDRKYQRILWHGPTGRKTYELNTVTFGLASAPFLAIRCLHQLADDEGHAYPVAAETLKRDLYVDDLLTGAATIEKARELRSEIIELLKLGGLHLRQWASNDMHILDDLPADELNHSLQLDKEQTLKTLGLYWNSKDDIIKYTVKPIAMEATVTKRKILSEIAKIFDPLGLLGPVIFYAKRMMQRLWLLKLDWDESVTHSIHTDWTVYCEELSALSNWSCERHILKCEPTTVQLHGFCDASEKGYGACIYVRSSDASGHTQSRLLCSKSRVAPLKTVTIPRLELCAAQLLARLLTQVLKTIDLAIDETFLWTDSMITLHWINTSPHILKTFVGNRVAEIQQNTKVEDWRHVRSEDNPADQLSRGQLPHEFLQNSMWKSGPSWLRNESSTWPKTVINFSADETEKKRINCFVSTTHGELFERFSSFTKLRRIIAYCLRFKSRLKGNLGPEELDVAEGKIIGIIQATAYADEVRELRKGNSVRNKSKLKSLDPFLDAKGILRVGGRLKNAQLPFEQQHPAILPRSHHVTSLIILQHHLQNYHAGIQTTLYSVRRKYWLIDGRSQVRKIIRTCIRCCRANPTTIHYTMGNLPSMRINKARPFCNVGVDYCGPFFIKEKKHRNRTKVKIYVAVFVCLVVKAIHLEVVSDLTTDGFLGALKRFISRRGKPTTISSDNGTNFVGANNELKELYALFNSDSHQTNTKVFLSERGIKWNFIPPLSPNFGGLWESTVKMFKHHLKRVMVNELFTFEEFNTLTIEIEAILNSRPLTPLSTDPNDLIALTPGHFLIGDSLTSLPTPDYGATPVNRLSRWQHLQKIRQDFWSRWSKEYLNELNVRTKWTKGEPSIQEGAIVLLKEDHLPPMQWSLGRVTAVHPGTDSIVRVVTVKTANSEFKRNVRRLAPLPIDDKDISQ